MATYVNDQAHAIFRGVTVPPQTLTANATGAAVDAAPAGANTLTVLVTVGAVSGTSPTLTVTLQASPDGSGDWVDVVTCPTITAANQVVAQVCTLPRPANLTAAPYRYVRANCVVGGTTPSFAACVHVLGLRKHPQPQLGAVSGPTPIN